MSDSESSSGDENSNSGEAKGKILPKVAKVNDIDIEKVKNRKAFAYENQAAKFKAQALKRMQDGVKLILSLHNPYELSAICGQLDLKTQQKGDVSLKLILDYCTVDGTMPEDRMRKLIHCLWEGAIKQYLDITGNALNSNFLDPKRAVLRLWTEGGLLDGGRSFTQHFIGREVQKKYDWIQSEDLIKELASVRAMQEKSKAAEHEILIEHDYTNILNYFHNIHELRKKEAKTRTFLIAEVELARNRVDYQKYLTKVHMDHMLECETQYNRCAEDINEKLAQYEYLNESYCKRWNQYEGQMQRLTSILDAYVYSHKTRDQKVLRQFDNNGNMELFEPENCLPQVREIAEKLKRYRDMRDVEDDNLRMRCQSHITEIKRLELYIRDLESHVNREYNRSNEREQWADVAERDIRFCAKKMVKMSVFSTDQSKQSWNCMLRFAAKVTEFESQRKVVESLIAAGTIHSNPTIKAISQALIDHCDFATIERVKELNEIPKMLDEDILADKVRKVEKKKAPAKKVATPSTGTRPKSKGKGKATVESSDDEGFATEGSKKSSKSKKESGGSSKKNDKSSKSRPDTSESAKRPNTAESAASSKKSGKSSKKK